MRKALLVAPSVPFAAIALVVLLVGGLLQVFIQSPAQAAETPAFVQSNLATTSSGASSTTQAVAFNSANTAGNLVVVAATAAGGGAISCSDTRGNSYTTAVSSPADSNGRTISICYAPNISAGSNTVTATFSASVQWRRVAIHEYSGVATASPVDGTSGNNGTSTSPGATVHPGSITASKPQALVFGAFAASAWADSLTAQNGATKRETSVPGTNKQDFATQDQVAASAGSVNSTIRINLNANTPWSGASVVFKPKEANKYVQGGTNTSNTSASTITASPGTTTAGNFIIASTSWVGSSKMWCTDNQNNSYTTATSTYDATSDRSLGICFARVTTAGATTVTINYGTATTNRRAIAAEYTGINEHNPVDIVRTNTAAGTTSANGVTSTAGTSANDGSLVFGSVMNVASTSTITAGTDFQQRNFTNNKDLAIQDRVQDTAGSVASTQTFGSAHRYMAHMVVFKPSGVGGGQGPAGTPTFVQANTNNDSATSSTISQSFASNNTAGNFIAVSVTWESSSASSFSCSDSRGNSYSVADSLWDSVNVQSVGMCYAPNIASGSNTVTVSFGTGRPWREIHIMEYSGVATTSPLDATSKNNGSATSSSNGTSSGTATASQDNSLVVGIAANVGGAGSFSAGTGFTQRASTQLPMMSESRVVNAGSTAATFTGSTSSGRFVAVMGIFKPQPPPSVAPNTPGSVNQTLTGGSAVSTGATIQDSNIRFTATGTDPDGSDMLSLCIELKPIATAFNGTQHSCGTGVAYTGSSVSLEHTINGLSAGTSYHWRARLLDTQGNYSGWQSYGGNSESAADFIYNPNANPNAPTNLAQTKTDTTPIPGTTLYDYNGTTHTWNHNGSPGNSLFVESGTKRSGSSSMGLEFSGGDIWTSDAQWSTTDRSSAGPVVSAWVYLPGTNTGSDWRSRISVYDASVTEVVGSETTLVANQWNLVTMTVPYDVHSDMQAYSIYTHAAGGGASGTNRIYIDDFQQGAGIWTNESSVRFTGSVSDSDNPDTLQLCVEKKPIGTAFTNTEDSCGTGVGVSGSAATATTTIGSLVNGTQYHWQARVKDAVGAYSSWVAFGANKDSVTASPDFGVDLSNPTAGTARDGTSQGVDANLNDGSLASLGANWSGFSDAASGIAYYEYSIGTTAGATDVAGWTKTSDTTPLRAGLDLVTGQSYFFNVRVTDVVGRTSSVVSTNGQAVAPTLEFAVSSNVIEFDRISSANSYAPATESLTVTTSTNGNGGYVVRQTSNGPLQSSTNTIPNYAGSYASPSTWSGTGFGYTSSDTAIQASGNKFNGATRYAGLSTSSPGDIVADHTAPISGAPLIDDARVLTYKVVGDSTITAGRYSTAISLSATAFY
jgi:hypothetical protein